MEAGNPALVVKNHREDPYKKHYPPRLNDEVWRLEKISKNGTFHQRLTRINVLTVGDFLQQLEINPNSLRNIFESCSTEIWNEIVDHATQCVVDDMYYTYHIASHGIGLKFNAVSKLVGAAVDGQNYQPLDQLTLFQKMLVEEMRMQAYENISDWVQIDERPTLGPSRPLIQQAEESAALNSASHLHFTGDVKDFMVSSSSSSNENCGPTKLPTQKPSSKTISTIHCLTFREEVLISPIMSLNRRKDIFLLVKSYKMALLYEHECEQWINEALQLLDAVRNLEENLSGLLVDFQLDGFEDSAEQLNAKDPLKGRLEIMLPKEMCEALYSDYTQLGPHGTLWYRTLLHRPEVFDLPINLSIHQILKNIKSRYINLILVSGRHKKNVMQALKDHTEVHSMFTIVLSITKRESRKIIDIQTDIAQQLSLKSKVLDEHQLRQEIFEKLKSTRFLLLAEECSEEVLFEVGIPVWKSLGVVVFTSRSNLMIGSMEIRTEDHLLSWNLFCRNVGEAILLPNIKEMALSIVQECQGHLPAVNILARALKDVTDLYFWKLALDTLCMPAVPDIEFIDEILIRSLAFSWEAIDIEAKHCIKSCASYRKGERIYKFPLVSPWIKEGLLYSYDQAHYIIQSLISSFLVEGPVSVEVLQELHDGLVKFLEHQTKSSLVQKQSRKKLMEPGKVEEWNTTEIYLMDDALSELPDSPICPALTSLHMQRNRALTFIPPLFFENMPLLQVLDLSYTSIKSLPESIVKLLALRKLFLRSCQLFMDLPPHVGELKNLEELDLEETEIVHLPKEIENLRKLKRLRLSFYGNISRSKKGVKSNLLIPAGVICWLSNLTELSIDVTQDNERWNATVKAIVQEVRHLRKLQTLNLYLPEAKLLETWSSEQVRDRLSRFSFVVGQHKRGIISRVPDEVEAHFKKWNKCLKLVNGRDFPKEISILEQANAFYLQNHATAVNLPQREIIYMTGLRFCVLTECHAMETIIEERMPSLLVLSGGTLSSLCYLGVYYMNNLRSLWEGPIRSKYSLSNLRLLAIHTCPKLSNILSLDLLANLARLEELIIEDCSEVTCLASHESNLKPSTCFLPSLKRVSLLFLPKLVSIFGGLNVAPELEILGFYNCPKLQSISKTEVSSEKLKLIKGEKQWWDDLSKWDEWGGNRPSRLDDIFSEIDEDKDVRTQFAEDGFFFHASGQDDKYYEV